MKTLLSITAVFECLTGIALIAIPSKIVPMLLGIPFDDDRLHVISGITGAALISIGMVCWLLRNSGASALAIVKSVLFYNVAGTLILLYAGIADDRDWLVACYYHTLRDGHVVYGCFGKEIKFSFFQ